MRRGRMNRYSEEDDDDKTADSLTVGISADDSEMSAEEKDAEAGPKHGPVVPVQPLRARRDYGASGASAGMCGCGCESGPNVEDPWISREEVAKFCADCADKMAKNGISRVRSSVFMGAVKDTAVKLAVKSFRKESSKTE